MSNTLIIHAWVGTRRWMQSYPFHLQLYYMDIYMRRSSMNRTFIGFNILLLRMIMLKSFWRASANKSPTWCFAEFGVAVHCMVYDHVLSTENFHIHHTLMFILYSESSGMFDMPFLRYIQSSELFLTIYKLFMTMYIRILVVHQNLENAYKRMMGQMGKTARENYCCGLPHVAS